MLKFIYIFLFSLNLFGECLVWESGKYKNSIDINETLSIDGVEKLQVCIKGETERGRDFITIYDSEAKLVKKLSGKIDRTFVINDSSIIVNLKSDDSVTKAGVTVSIDKIFDNYCLNCSENFETGEYLNNTFIRKTLLIPDATKIKVSIMGESEKNLDYIKIYDFNYKFLKQFSGEINSSFEVDSPSIVVEFFSDNSITKKGVNVQIEKVEQNDSIASFSIGDLNNKRDINSYSNNSYIEKTLLLPNAESAELIINGSTEINYDILEVSSTGLKKKLSGEISEKIVLKKPISTRSTFSTKSDYEGVRVDLKFKSDATNSSGGIDIELKKLN